MMVPIVAVSVIVIVISLAILLLHFYNKWNRPVGSSSGIIGDAPGTGIPDDTGSTPGSGGAAPPTPDHSGSTGGVTHPPPEPEPEEPDNPQPEPTVPVHGPPQCPRCPTVACPPSTKFQNSFYFPQLNRAGLDGSKLSECNNYLYYDGAFTCVRTSDSPNNLCDHAAGVCVPDNNLSDLPDGSTCGKAGTYGSYGCQFDAVKLAIDGGLDAVACPLLS